MKKINVKCIGTMVAALVALALVPLTALAVEKEVPEGKVAIVNGSVITQVDFDREFNMVKERFSMMGRPLSESQIPETRKEVLENLINRELLYQESKKKGIKIDAAVVNEQLGKWKKQFPNEGDFAKALSSLNLTEASLKSQFEQGMAIKQLINKEFEEKVSISDSESKSFYDTHPDDFKQPEQVKASHILIKVDPKADTLKKAEARKKIEEIQKKLKAGGDFAALAKENSQCPSSSKGGDLGYFSRGQMVKPFEDAAFSLKPGEVGGIVETNFGYHLIKVIDKKPETTILYQDVKDKLAKYLKQEKVAKEVDQYVEKLKEKSKVERFLKAS